ncbi:hypothetical protein ACU5DF_13025 [Aliivibrio wodanis]|uniref:hypothetical protein n=1 Tax=Aliivibrio wodanis TaxID=80852 RepID=UPI00406D3A5D
MNDYELFIKVNDAILLEFDVFKPWEENVTFKYSKSINGAISDFGTTKKATH